MILTVTPNPCVDKTVYIETLVPGGRYRSEKYTCIAGGKGTNAARAVKTMGRAATAMVIAGGPTGQHVVSMIEQDDGLPCLPVWVAGMTRTITTVLESNPHRQTAFFDPGSPVTEEEAAKVVHCFAQALEDGVSAVTLNGTVPDPVLTNLYTELIPLAKKAGIPVILDSHGPEFAAGLRALPTLIKPNQDELERHYRRRLEPRSAQWTVVEELHAIGIPWVVLSMGADGALVSWPGGRAHAVPPQIDEVNPVGSGDCLVAGLAIGLAEGWDPERTIRTGIAMGTANAMSWDIGHFSREQVEEIAGQVELREG